MVTADPDSTDADAISFKLGSIFGTKDVEINEINENEPDEVFSDLVYSITDGSPQNFTKEKPVADVPKLQKTRFPVLSEKEID